MKQAEESKKVLSEYLKDYRYQPDLTQRLDSPVDGAFTQEKINEIVLWKVNRYAPLSADSLAALNSTKSIAAGSHREADTCIRQLLKQPGVDLPMASTLLRFRNPEVFQIIDRHAYRALYGDDYPLYTKSGESRKVDLYFKYLDDLSVLCTRSGINFKDSDRILYIFDKQENGAL